MSLGLGMALITGGVGAISSGSKVGTAGMKLETETSASKKFDDEMMVGLSSAAVVSQIWQSYMKANRKYSDAGKQYESMLKSNAKTSEYFSELGPTFILELALVIINVLDLLSGIGTPNSGAEFTTGTAWDACKLQLKACKTGAASTSGKTSTDDGQTTTTTYWTSAAAGWQGDAAIAYDNMIDELIQHADAIEGTDLHTKAQVAEHFYPLEDCHYGSQSLILYINTIAIPFAEWIYALPYGSGVLASLQFQFATLSAAISTMVPLMSCAGSDAGKLAGELYTRKDEYVRHCDAINATRAKIQPEGAVLAQEYAKNPTS